MLVTTGKGAPKEEPNSSTECIGERPGTISRLDGSKGLRVRGWGSSEQGSGYMHVLVDLDVRRGCGQPKKEKPAGNGVGKSIDVGPALNPPSQSSLGALLCTLFFHPSIMSSSAIYAVSPPSPSF